MHLGCKQKSGGVLIRSAFFLVCLTSASVPTAAQDSANPAAEKWRAKDGLYAEPGADLGERCMDHNELIVELADKSISGDEWNCKISKFTDFAPGSVRLDGTCTELDDKPYKTVFSLKKIDDRTILYGASTKGKKIPGDKCLFALRKPNASMPRQKRGTWQKPNRRPRRDRPKPAAQKWRPKTGPYAQLGADFGKRCKDFGDATIDLAEKTIGSSEQECKIINLTDTASGAIRLDVSCVDTERENPHKEIILLKKVDEKAIFYRQSYKENFKYPGVKYFYCPEEAQRMYIESKKIK
jgi:hypothetical protein